MLNSALPRSREARVVQALWRSASATRAALGVRLVILCSQANSRIRVCQARSSSGAFSSGGSATATALHHMAAGAARARVLASCLRNRHCLASSHRIDSFRAQARVQRFARVQMMDDSMSELSLVSWHSSPRSFSLQQRAPSKLPKSLESMAQGAYSAFIDGVVSISPPICQGS